MFNPLPVLEDGGSTRGRAETGIRAPEGATTESISAMAETRTGLDSRSHMGLLREVRPHGRGSATRCETSRSDGFATRHKVAGRLCRPALRPVWTDAATRSPGR